MADGRRPIATRFLLTSGRGGVEADGATVVADPDYESRIDEDATQDSHPSLRSSDLRGGAWSRLPGTRREAEEVAALVGEADVAIHLGREATEKRVKALSAHRIIHLATHGFFLDQQTGPPG